MKRPTDLTSSEMTTTPTDALIALLWRETTPPPAMWLPMMAAAQRHGVFPTLAFVAASKPLPDALSAQFREARHQASLRRLRAEQQLHQIGALAQELGIPLILLKGPVTATAYPHPAARTFGDFDVMTPSEALAQQLFAALQARGYQPFSESRTPHLTPLAPPDNALTVEIHCDAFMRLPTLRSDPVWWETATPLPGRPGLLALAPVEHALYIIIHAVEKHGLEMGLRGLYDFACWTRRWSEPDWEATAARAEARGVTRALRVIAALEAWAQGQPWESRPWGPYLAPPPEDILAAARRALFGATPVKLPSIWRDLPRNGWRGWLAYTHEIITAGERMPASQIPRRITYLVRTHGPGLWKLLSQQSGVQQNWNTQRILQDWLHDA